MDTTKIRATYDGLADNFAGSETRPGAPAECDGADGLAGRSSCARCVACIVAVLPCRDERHRSSSTTNVSARALSLGQSGETN